MSTLLGILVLVVALLIVGCAFVLGNGTATINSRVDRAVDFKPDVKYQPKEKPNDSSSNRSPLSGPGVHDGGPAADGTARGELTPTESRANRP